MPTESLKAELLEPLRFTGEVMSYGIFDEEGDLVEHETCVIYLDIPLSCGLPRYGDIIVVNGIDRRVTASNIAIGKGGKRAKRVGIEFNDVRPKI